MVFRSFSLVYLFFSGLVIASFFSGGFSLLGRDGSG